jgi:rfaE bifunctional protein nucleotidyltransferase chain/domain
MSLLSLNQALALRKGRRLVFTNGVFDILHAGHVRCLEQARKLGDLLFIGLNSDASARSLGKGPGRPHNSLEDRAAVLSALRCVDGVVALDELTPEGLIEALRPEIHVKGGDYRVEDLPEATLVRSYGGEIVILPLLEGRSTTGLLERLQSE